MRWIFRNFIRIFQRFRLAMTLNILGLSIAFVAFMLLIMQWTYDRTFDTFDPHADSIYRIDMNTPSSERGHIALMNRPISEIITQSSPHFKAGVLFRFSVEQAYTIEGETPTTFLAYEWGVSKDLTKVFHFDMIEGDANALEIEHSVLVPESFARKWFPNESAVGKSLRSSSGSYMIGGVYKDFPQNNTLQNYVYTSIGDENKGIYSNWSYNFYILTDIPNNADEVKKIVMECIHKITDNTEEVDIEFDVLQLNKIHSSEPALYDPTPRTGKQTMALLLSIAVVILLIATINFTNFSTAVSPLRIKNVNTQKVFGATTGSLRRSLLLESILVGLFSFILALMILWMLQDTSIIRLFKADTRIVSHPILVIITGIASILIGLMAALYPAHYTTSFQPAIALKGSFGISPKGKALRHLLISFQFIASFALIIAALFMYLQNRYAHTTSLGFDKEQLIITNMGNIGNKCQVFEQQLKRHPEIEDVTFANVQLCNEGNNYMNWGRNYKDQNISYNVLEVAPSFPRVMGIKPYEGRDFREEDMNTRHGVYLFNETAVKRYNFKIGDAIDSTTIVGFVPDFIYNSLHMETPPAALLLWGKIKWGEEANWDTDGRWYSYSYVKTKAGADLHKAMETVYSELKALSPDYPFDVRFFDSVLDQLYKDDQQLSSVITLFSLLAVFISIMGIFGLVVFDSEYKRKEIGIRKVLGSTTWQILLLFNKGYIRTLVVCFCIAVPIAYYGISRWLENFVYKIPIYWWVFPIAFLLVGGITILTITYQSWHAANENPVNSLKSE